ncbi:putative membrane protein [Sinorhizobium fredii]
MYEFAIAWEWLAFAVRWLHAVTAIAWIGSSFYFVALDLGLVKRDHLPPGAYGEEWQVHGGGFYHIQKYLVAPATMPEHLTWFKWESYSTWLTGFAMLCIVYYGGADLFLVDRHVLDISATTAILISLASLGVGWVLYDLLCKSPIGKNTWGLMALLYVVLVAMAWGYTQVFTGRAAFLHLGAFTATIMSANVFFIIIPNQKIVVADLIAGRTPDPRLGAQAKQRSLHNNYLTLPVIFFMLSNHYPLAFATAFNWIIAALVFLMGVTIRHWFNTHSRAQGQTDLDLARDGDPLHPDHMALDRAEGADWRRAGRGRTHLQALCRKCTFPRRQGCDRDPLQHVSCRRARLRGHCPRPEGRHTRERRRDCRPGA